MLTLIRELPRGKGLYRCHCGTEHITSRANVNAGRTSSCGCYRREIAAAKLAGYAGNTIHGGYHSRAHSSWHMMVQRCTNPNRVQYKYYGGRGIEVCWRWRDFANFSADMGERPEGYTLERIDNNGNYEPGNCKWATWAEQAKNRRRKGEA